MTNSSPLDRMIQKEELTLVEKAIQGLEEQHCEIFQLHVYQSLTHQQIAAKLGITKEASEKRLERARQALAKELAY